jgi:hypothetical protein
MIDCKRKHEDYISVGWALDFPETPLTPSGAGVGECDSLDVPDALWTSLVIFRHKKKTGIVRAYITSCSGLAEGGNQGIVRR